MADAPYSRSGLGVKCAHRTGGFDAGQLGVQALKLVGQAAVIKAQHIQHRCVNVADMHRILNSGVSKFIGRAVGLATFDTTACEP